MDAMNIGLLLLLRPANRDGSFAGRPAGGSDRAEGRRKRQVAPGPGSVSLYFCSGCRRRDGRCNTAPGVPNDRWLFEQATDAMKLFSTFLFISLGCATNYSGVSCCDKHRSLIRLVLVVQSLLISASFPESNEMFQLPFLFL